MSALRAAPLVRTAAAAAAAACGAQTRSLAIAATVQHAADTSAERFPAPSHVSLTAEAAELAHQLKRFYSDPDSVIVVPDDVRHALHAEVLNKVGAMPDASVPDAWAKQNLQIPSEIRLGDNPLFASHQK